METWLGKLVYSVLWLVPATSGTLREGRDGNCLGQGSLESHVEES